MSQSQRKYVFVESFLSETKEKSQSNVGSIIDESNTRMSCSQGGQLHYNLHKINSTNAYFSLPVRSVRLDGDNIEAINKPV